MAQSPARLSRSGSPVSVSFEFFPPKSEEMERTLWEAIARLAPLEPRFVSVTYGAGGSTRERTHATVARIVKETRLEPAAHLTCVGASREEIDAFLAEAGLAPVETRLVPPAAGEPGKLTVALWLARDPRLISDDLRNASREFA